jgi:hypothetical protein
MEFAFLCPIALSQVADTTNSPLMDPYLVDGLEAKTKHHEFNADVRCCLILQLGIGISMMPSKARFSQHEPLKHLYVCFHKK